MIRETGRRVEREVMRREERRGRKEREGVSKNEEGGWREERNERTGRRMKPTYRGRR